MPRVRRPDTEGDDADGCHQHDCVEPELRVAEVLTGFAKSAEVKGERRPGDEHEGGDHPLGVGAEAGDGRRLGAESAGGHCREGVCDGLEEGHIAGPEQQGL